MGEEARILERARQATRELERGMGTRRRGNIPAIGELRAVPDAELITTLVSVGMPLVEAQTIRHSPQQRFCALQVWADVDAAGRGDAEAKARVDYLKDRFQELRRNEHVADDPRRVV